MGRAHEARGGGEATGGKTVPQYKTDVNGFLKLEYVKQENSVDVSSFMDLKNALTRRGLALEASELMSFSAHESIVNEYFRALHAEAMEEHRRVTINQAHAIWDDAPEIRTLIACRI